MDKEDVKRLADNPNFISGIHNYCDRWCERCPFTARCMNFALSEEQFGDQEAQDINNESFWEKLSETFKVTLELLKETAEREGIDLDAIDVEETMEEEKLNEEIAESHLCCRAAKAYSQMVSSWFHAVKDFFDPDEDERRTRFDIVDTGSDGVDTHFEEATEVVRWYQHQIYVKLIRAVRGSLEDRLEILDEFPKDSDGSAKVALIGIDRSIAAWGEIRNIFPLLGKEALDLILHLEQLRRNVEKEFPDARAFIRPGFDKIDLNS
jgi:hypothetical protein